LRFTSTPADSNNSSAAQLAEPVARIKISSTGTPAFEWNTKAGSAPAASSIFTIVIREGCLSIIAAVSADDRFCRRFGSAPRSRSSFTTSSHLHGTTAQAVGCRCALLPMVRSVHPFLGDQRWGSFSALACSRSSAPL
jgi:hypothetical protein